MLIPYENLNSRKKSQESAFIEALEVLSTGWSRRSYPKIDINSPIAWKLNSQDERSWNFYIHSWDMIDTLLYACNLKYDERLFEPALKISLDWIEKYVDQKNNCPMKNESSMDFAWYDMAVGLRAYRLAYIYDIYKESAEEEDLVAKKLWSGLLAHQVYLSEDSNITFHNNHGYYQATGQIAMGRRFSQYSKVMAEALEQGIERFKIMLNQQFTKDGVHREHSPDYHRMVYETLIGVIKAGLIQDKHILSFTSKIEEALSWFILPNQYIANFGDSDWRLMRIKSTAADKKWLTPEMKFVTTNGDIGKLPEETLKNFVEAGYFILRQQTSSHISDFEQYSYLAQTAAFHSRTHKHADDLSFIWYDRGCNILIDAGRYGYIGKAEIGTDLWKQGYWYTHPHRLYVESTRAHNTLEFDNINYPRKGIKPYGSATRRYKQYDNGLVVLETECNHFKSIRRARVIIYMPNQWLIVFDWYKDNSNDLHDVKQWFNFSPQAKVSKESNAYHVNLDKNKNLYVTSLLNEAKASEVIEGAEKPKLQGWFSPSERELIPIKSINYEVITSASSCIATLFRFDTLPKIDYEKNSVNSSGRKASFSWSDNIGHHKIEMIREKNTESLSCKYNIK